METQTSVFQAAIDELEKDIADLERKWNGLVDAVNLLREKSGLPPRGPSGPSKDGSISPGIQGSAQPSRPDLYYGKRMGTAAREYLEARQAQGLGAASSREIFHALTAGGYQFKGKSQANQLVVLRRMLRKSSQTFHKLPNETWGLRSWYKNLKEDKESSPGAEEMTTNKVADSEEPAEEAENNETAATEESAAA